jgi:hypothetical protein
VDAGVALAEQSFACFVEAAPQQALRTLSLLIGLAFQRATPRRSVASSSAWTRCSPASATTRPCASPSTCTAPSWRSRTRTSSPCSASWPSPSATRPAPLAHANRAVQLLPPLAPPQYRGQLRFVHARALRGIDDKARAIAVAEEAIADYEAAGPGFAGQVAEIRAWLADSVRALSEPQGLAIHSSTLRSSGSAPRPSPVQNDV